MPYYKKTERLGAERVKIRTVITAAAGAAAGCVLAGVGFYHLALGRGGYARPLQKSRRFQKRQAGKKSCLCSPEDTAWLEEQARRWQLVSGEGLHLSAYYLPQTGSRRTVIICHGYGDSARRMSSVARRFYRQGFSLLLSDARGHGHSQGKEIGMGWPERLDLLGWIRKLLLHDPETEILLYGVSMGAATVMAAAGEPLPPQVKCVIEDSGYSSVERELASQIHRKLHLPAFPLLTVASGVCHRRQGFFFREADLCRQLEKCRLPVLMIHGTADRFVPFSMLSSLHAAAAGEKEQLVVEGAGHIGAMKRDGQHYWETVDGFWQRYMTKEISNEP